NTTAPLVGGGDLSADRTHSINDFVGAGAAHARGTVPDPGATAHPNDPHVLRDDGTWEMLSGGALGFHYWPTQGQTTTSGSATDVGGAQATGSFTLDAATNVMFWGWAFAIVNTAGATARIYAVLLNNVGATVWTQELNGGTVSTANGAQPLGGAYSSKLAAGTYSAKRHFSIRSATTPPLYHGQCRLSHM